MEEFEGILSSIDPKIIIDFEKGDDTAAFFLGLALIYNDLKGVMLFDRTITDSSKLRWRMSSAQEVLRNVSEA